MSRVVVASHNPVKVAAARHAFERMLPTAAYSIESVSVPSGVGDQPTSSRQTLDGARNRARAARDAFPHAAFWVGIEGGIEDSSDGMCAFAWAVVESSWRRGKGRTATFFLPEVVADLVRGGKELGEADDIVFGQTLSKQQGGAIGLLTGDVIDRTSLYEAAVVIALIPFKNEALFASHDANSREHSA